MHSVESSTMYFITKLAVVEQNIETYAHNEPSAYKIKIISQNIMPALPANILEESEYSIG